MAGRRKAGVEPGDGVPDQCDAIAAAAEKEGGRRGRRLARPPAFPLFERGNRQIHALGFLIQKRQGFPRRSPLTFRALLAGVTAGASAWSRGSAAGAMMSAMVTAAPLLSRSLAWARVSLPVDGGGAEGVEASAPAPRVRRLGVRRTSAMARDTKGGR